MIFSVGMSEAPMSSDHIKAATVATAWLQARLCDARAERASSDDERRLFIHLRNSWIGFANDVQLADGLKSGGADDAAQERHAS
jgi:hypothetical protein